MREFADLPLVCQLWNKSLKHFLPECCVVSSHNADHDGENEQGISTQCLAWLKRRSPRSLRTVTRLQLWTVSKDDDLTEWLELISRMLHLEALKLCIPGVREYEEATARPWLLDQWCPFLQLFEFGGTYIKMPRVLTLPSERLKSLTLYPDNPKVDSLARVFSACPLLEVARLPRGLTLTPELANLWGSRLRELSLCCSELDLQLLSLLRVLEKLQLSACERSEGTSSSAKRPLVELPALHTLYIRNEDVVSRSHILASDFAHLAYLASVTIQIDSDEHAEQILRASKDRLCKLCITDHWMLEKRHELTGSFLHLGFLNLRSLIVYRSPRFSLQHVQPNWCPNLTALSFDLLTDSELFKDGGEGALPPLPLLQELVVYNISHPNPPSATWLNSHPQLTKLTLVLSGLTEDQRPYPSSWWLKDLSSELLTRLTELATNASNYETFIATADRALAGRTSSLRPAAQRIKWTMIYGADSNRPVNSERLNSARHQLSRALPGVHVSLRYNRSNDLLLNCAC